MKKLFLLSCILFSIIASAQVQVDKVEEDGSRLMFTKDFHLYDYKLVYAGYANLAYQKLANDEELYTLVLVLNEGKMTIDKGRKLLLKFTDDSILELENTIDIAIYDNELQHSRSTSYYLVKPQYIITEDDIKKIIDVGVNKMRIENNNGYLDRKINSKNFSKRLGKAYNAIIEKKATSNGIRDGF